LEREYVSVWGKEGEREGGGREERQEGEGSAGEGNGRKEASPEDLIRLRI
jgi:hypothetical protein